MTLLEKIQRLTPEKRHQVEVLVDGLLTSVSHQEPKADERHTPEVILELISSARVTCPNPGPDIVGILRSSRDEVA